MKQLFATKRNPNGYRLLLAVDHETKTYATEITHWFCKEDMTAEVTKRERRAMMEALEADGYTEIERMSI